MQQLRLQKSIHPRQWKEGREVVGQTALAGEEERSGRRNSRVSPGKEEEALLQKKNGGTKQPTRRNVYKELKDLKNGSERCNN